MQNRHVDATHHFRSLDDSYHYTIPMNGGQLYPHLQTILYRNSVRGGSLVTRIGDTVNILRNRLDGSCIGVNSRTGYRGSYKCYLGEWALTPVDFPTYPQVTQDAQEESSRFNFTKT